jgi:hypothetical protein
MLRGTSPLVTRRQRAKTDRLDTELLMRAFLGWLRGEKRVQRGMHLRLSISRAHHDVSIVISWIVG